MGFQARADAGRATGLTVEGRCCSRPPAVPVRQVIDQREERRSPRHQDRPDEQWVRVPQDIDSEVVSGHATAIPVPPAVFRPGSRKQRAGALLGPADGVAVPSGPWCEMAPGPLQHGSQRGAMAAGDSFGRLDDDCPACTMARAAEGLGTTRNFLRALRRSPPRHPAALRRRTTPATSVSACAPRPGPGNLPTRDPPLRLSAASSPRRPTRRSPAPERNAAPFPARDRATA